ncbi:hypothetical protein H9P43_004021 [Blastocladiella emersonii ATCC 22665]|nr:hypothetical protein H9P43_004021 [Blastocladiella emersonii ATCC 22665]
MAVRNWNSKRPYTVPFTESPVYCQFQLLVNVVAQGDSIEARWVLDGTAASAPELLNVMSERWSLVIGGEFQPNFRGAYRQLPKPASLITHLAALAAFAWNAEFLETISELDLAVDLARVGQLCAGAVYADEIDEISSSRKAVAPAELTRTLAWLFKHTLQPNERKLLQSAAASDLPAARLPLSGLLLRLWEPSMKDALAHALECYPNELAAFNTIALKRTQ